MKEKTQHIRYFLFSQYLSDGVRITLEIILPAIIFTHFGQLQTGLLLSTGALCVSMADAPGPPDMAACFKASGTPARGRGDEQVAKPAAEPSNVDT